MGIRPFVAWDRRVTTLAEGLLSRRVLVAVLLLVWTACLWMLLTSSSVRAPTWMPWRHWLANVAHAPLFGLQALLVAYLARPLQGARDRRALWVAGLVCLAYGVLLEWWQGHVGRTASVLDVVTDAVGTFGVPWAMASGRTLGPRTALVLAAALLAGGMATVMV